MKPATPVTTQALGAETSWWRRWGYGAEITSSQWKGTRRADSGQLCAGAQPLDQTRRPSRQSTRGDKASSIPGEPKALSSISRVSTGAYERGGTLLCAGLHFLVAALPHSCGGRTTTHTHVSQQRFLGSSWAVASFSMP
jgi:hypothetical protein